MNKMTINKLEAVMWRLRKQHPDTKYISNKDLRRAVMYEIGTDMRTYSNTRKALKDIGYIRIHGKTRFVMTGVDIHG